VTVQTGEANRAGLTVDSETNRRLTVPEVSPLMSLSRDRWYSPSYSCAILTTVSLSWMLRISTIVASSVPNPLMALCSCLAWNSIGSVISATITSSKLPRSSLFSSLIRSLPYIVLN
jgi:hypothetical protein